MAVEAFVVTGLTLLVFGLVFVIGGRVGERGYWTQRDTTEAPGQDDTGVGAVARRVGHYAMHGTRPSLRMMAIGLILVLAGVVIALVGLVLAAAR